MTETELRDLDLYYPYKATQAGQNKTTRFDSEQRAIDYFLAAETTCLITSYINGVYKVLKYKWKIKQ